MAERIDRWFCACASYPDDPGMVVCWRCEQPLAENEAKSDDDALVHNLLLVGIRNRRALEKIADDSKRPELANAEHLGGIANGVLG